MNHDDADDAVGCEGGAATEDDHDDDDDYAVIQDES